MVIGATPVGVPVSVEPCAQPARRPATRAEETAGELRALRLALTEATRANARLKSERDIALDEVDRLRAQLGAHDDST